MHPLRVTLIVSLGIAAIVAFAFTEALHRGGVSQSESAIFGACVFIAYLIPWAAVSAWALRRAADLDRLTDRARSVAGGDYDRPIADREYHGELDDLGRAVEEIRAVVVRQKASFDEQRATMEQIVAALGEGLLALSPRGKVVFANAVVGELFGAPRNSPFGPRTLANFVARTTLSRRSAMALPISSSLRPTPYISAVSRKLPPASRKRWMTRIDSSSFICEGS